MKWQNVCCIKLNFRVLFQGLSFSMNQSTLLVLYMFLFFLCVEAQTNLPEEVQSSQDVGANFQPSLALLIGIGLFSLTFFLLIYAKFYRKRAEVDGHSPNQPGLVQSAPRFSGIDKTVIESLPFFRFSSLRGSKQGLECAVCLSKFQDIEILRLLPKCRHAFHINCIDQWLEKHSTCPLCRCKVNADDPTIFTHSNSMRFIGNQSDAYHDSNLELFVQREENNQGSSRFSIGSSFREVDKGDKEEESLIEEVAEGSDGADDQKVLDKFNCRINVSDIILKNRWSCVSSSDLIFLNLEMLTDESSKRFYSLDLNCSQFARSIEDEQIMKIKEDMEIKRYLKSKVTIAMNKNYQISIPVAIPSTSDSSPTSRTINSVERRSVSEITAFSRFQNMNIKSTIKGSYSSDESNVKEERLRRRWLLIATSTVQWFANRERQSQESLNTRLALDV